MSEPKLKQVEAVTEIKTFVGVGMPEIVSTETEAGIERLVQFQVSASDWRLINQLSALCPEIRAVRFTRDFENGVPATATLELDVDLITITEDTDPALIAESDKQAMEMSWVIHRYLMSLLPNAPKLGAGEINAEAMVQFRPLSIAKHAFELDYNTIDLAIADYVQGLKKELRSLNSRTAHAKRKQDSELEILQNALDEANMELGYISEVSFMRMYSLLAEIYDFAALVEQETDFDTAIAHIKQNYPWIMNFAEFLEASFETPWIKDLLTGLNAPAPVETDSDGTKTTTELAVHVALES